MVKDNERFHAILGELGALHDKKMKDYGEEDNPFANVRGSEEWGIEPWIGALVRATDKLKRLQKYARVGKLANEAVEDSFRDLAVYAIIGLVLYEQSEGSLGGVVGPIDPDKGDGLLAGTPETDPWSRLLTPIGSRRLVMSEPMYPQR